jgi:hypothetical protein
MRSAQQAEGEDEGFPVTGRCRGVSHTMMDEGNLRLIVPAEARLGAFTKPAIPKGLAGFHVSWTCSMSRHDGAAPQGADR